MQIITGLLLVPYLVGHLGRAAYGFIPIAGIMTQYVNILSHNVATSVNRYLTLALHRNDFVDARRVFNTAFFVYLGIVLAQIPAFGLIIYHANAVFTIPGELLQDATLLFVCSALAFLINLVSSVYSVAFYANNRLDISRLIDIARLVIRFTGILICFGAFGPALRYVGYVNLANAVIVGATTVLVGKRFAPMLRLSFRCFDWRKVRQLTEMSWWLFVNYFGFLLFLKVDVWVCNRFVGAEAAGDYAAVLQWAHLIRRAGYVLSGTVSPMIMIYCARQEMERMVSLGRVSVRLFSLVLAIPISVICVFSSSLLAMWLGESFAGLWSLMVIMLCHLTINVGVAPLFNIQVAVNKVRCPGLVTFIMGLVNLCLAILLAKYLGYGIHGVAIAGAIVLTAKNSLFTPVYAAIITRRPWHTFLKPLLSSAGFLIGLSLLALVVRLYFRPVSIAHVAAVSVSLGTVGLVFTWLILSKRERRLMIDLAPARLSRLVGKFA